MDPRVVVLVGPRPRGERPPVTALASSREVVVIAIGWPFSEAQRQVVEAAHEGLVSARIPVEAVLVASAGEAAALLRPDDVVHALVGRRDAQRLRRAGVGLSAPSAP